MQRRTCCGRRWLVAHSAARGCYPAAVLLHGNGLPPRHDYWTRATRMKAQHATTLPKTREIEAVLLHGMVRTLYTPALC